MSLVVGGAPAAGEGTSLESAGDEDDMKTAYSRFAVAGVHPSPKSMASSRSSGEICGCVSDDISVIEVAVTRYNTV